MNTPSDNAKTTARVEAFSDGVFAIIITLLVLEIKVPHLHDVFSNHEAWDALKELTPKFVSFILSFFYIATFWVNHHQFFHVLKETNSKLIWLNNFLLLLLAFVPFPTGFMGEYPHNSVALALFSVILMLAALSFTFMWHYAMRKKLVDQSIPAAYFVTGLKRGLLGPVLYGAAAVIAFIEPWGAWAIFFFVPVYYFLPLQWRGHQVKN
jgi:uncharacterized membrane protein